MKLDKAIKQTIAGVGITDQTKFLIDMLGSYCWQLFKVESPRKMIEIESPSKMIEIESPSKKKENGMVLATFVRYNNPLYINKEVKDEGYETNKDKGLGFLVIDLNKGLEFNKNNKEWFKNSIVSPFNEDMFGKKRAEFFEQSVAAMEQNSFKKATDFMQEACRGNEDYDKLQKTLKERLIFSKFQSNKTKEPVTFGSAKTLKSSNESLGM